MQFWGFCMVHHKYRIRAPHRALWCWLSYALFGALFLHFYLDETTYEKSEYWIESEKMYEVLYQTEILGGN